MSGSTLPRDPQPDPIFTAYLTHTPHMATMPRNMLTLEAKSLPNDLNWEPKLSQFNIKNQSKTDKSKISFFLAIPTLVASSILGIYDLSQEGNHELNAMALISVVFSFIFAYLTIKFFLNYIKKFSLTIFVVYRLLISLILIYLIYL